MTRLYYLSIEKIEYVSTDATTKLTEQLTNIIERAGFFDDDGKFLSKSEFKTKGYLGSGGIGRFRDSLWAGSLAKKSVQNLELELIQEKANKNRGTVYAELNNDESD